MNRLPVIPTLLVTISAITMIGLGIWQLERADEKAALISRYSDAQTQLTRADWPVSQEAVDDALYRQATVNCAKVLSIDGAAGTSASGAKGWAHTARCILDTGSPARVALGFSRAPQGPDWSGGEASGTIAPGPRLVADPPLAGLDPLAAPDPKDIPNNHLAYAGQWFFFALTALVIFILAVRRKRRD